MKSKKDIPAICLSSTGSLIQFIKAPNKNYLSVLRFEDGNGEYLGALDKEWARKDLRQLQRWVNACLKK